MNNLNAVKLLFGFMFIFMIYLVIDTSLKSDMFNLPKEVINEPWFRTTLVDFYCLITALSVWVIYREKSGVAKFLWILSFVCLGSIGVSLYILIQLKGLKEAEELQKIFLPKE